MSLRAPASDPPGEFEIISKKRPFPNQKPPQLRPGFCASILLLFYETVPPVSAPPGSAYSDKDGCRYLKWSPPFHGQPLRNQQGAKPHLNQKGSVAVPQVVGSDLFYFGNTAAPVKLMGQIVLGKGEKPLAGGNISGILPNMSAQKRGKGNHAVAFWGFRRGNPVVLSNL